MVRGEEVTIAEVGEEDLGALLPLMRAYCDFYAVDPSDAALLALSRALIRDPAREGVQLIARDRTRRALGFTTLFWTRNTLSASRIAILNDLFVVPEARGAGLADTLIEASRARSRRHAATEMTWQTARDNARAQAVYERVGARREEWVDYSLVTG